MIRLHQIKMPRTHSEADLRKQCAKLLRVNPSDIKEMTIVRKSLDARKKPELLWVYIVDVRIPGETRFLKKNHNKNISQAPDSRYHMPAYDTEKGIGALRERPVIVGAGPCGLFCAYILALNGYAPIVLERGREVDRRQKDVEAFWESGNLNTESNVQFGEGGAGTFSDGKLNTLVKDSAGRNLFVRKTFVELGAPEEVLYQQHPHLGTDQLMGIVKRLRREIIRLGGEFRFDTKMTDIVIQDDQTSSSALTPTNKPTTFTPRRVTGIQINNSQELPVEVLVLALGHSARDTMEMLYKKDIPMEPKPFALGCRVEHLQSLINEIQYGEPYPEDMSAAEYKVTATTDADTELERGVYSFCMCPGGFVVNASSEPEMLAVNGMSNQDRGERNANSAIVMTVRPEDYRSYASPNVPEALSGIAFQRDLEHRAWLAAQGRIPVQRLEDFKKDRSTTELGSITPNTKGKWAFGDVRGILPEDLSDSFIKGMDMFDRKLPGFAGDDVLIEGLESRTSSPVRIPRNEDMESAIGGIYPAGEGAGYAGGIMSAAIDGIKVAEAVIRKYAPSHNSIS